MAIIYKVTNILNSKSYIGKAAYSLEKRIYGHKKCLNNSTTHFHNALRKYGFENFRWEILYETKKYSKKKLEKKEKFFIKKYKTNETGYNMTEGGDGGDVLSNHPNKKEICEKLSLASMGRKKSKEEIKKISDNQPTKGKKLNKKQRNKISKSTKKAMWRSDIRKRYLKGLKKRNVSDKNNPFYGKKHSKTSKRKISISQKRIRKLEKV